MKNEVDDLADEIATLQSGGIWSSDTFTQPFLHHLDKKQQLALVAHLKAGEIRSALGMIADAAYRCGMRDAPSALASGRAKLVPSPIEGLLPRVEFLPPRIPPTIGIILCHALAMKAQRSVVMRVLRKGGAIQEWGMTNPVTLPVMSKRDADEWLAEWPYKSTRGGMRR